MLSKEEELDLDMQWESFISQARGKTFDNLHDSLEGAFADLGTAQQSENHKGAVASFKHGLVIVPTTSHDETSSSLGRFLCAILLNYHNAHPGNAASLAFHPFQHQYPATRPCTFNFSAKP